jgi:intracellular multiplication protein IcmP
MAASQQAGGNQDNSAGILWGIAAIFAVLGGVWFAFKTQIVTGYLWVKLYEVKFISLFVSSDYLDRLQAAILAALSVPQAVNFHDLILIGSGVGSWLRIPFTAILIVLAFFVYQSNTARTYRNTYQMKDLAKLEKDNWPQISPVVGLDLLKTDIDTGPWAMGMTPMQYCKRHRILEEVRVRRTETMSRKDWDKIEVVLKRGQANKLFALQLGPLWMGTSRLPVYMRALFAVFAARINADSKSAENLLRQLAASSISRLDTSGTDELLRKHENTKLVQEIVQRHAYVFTVMAAMLRGAREDGVQASADFLWLKPLDRRLWYTLNTVGRQTPFVEVGGIFAHWIAENEAGRKLLVPMVEQATNALEIALKEIVYKPDEK